MNIKKYAFKMYRLIYHFPFNNSKHGKISIRNDGSILINCKIKSRGDNNTIIFAQGGYIETAVLSYMEAIIV